MSSRYLSTASEATSEFLQRYTYSYCQLIQTMDHQFASPRATGNAPTILSTAELQHLSEPFSHFDSMNKSTQRRIKCFYCKRYGHKIRSCRYKRRNDKRLLRSLQSSSETTATLISNQDVTCCSTEHDAATHMIDSSSSDNSVSLSCNTEMNTNTAADMDFENGDNEYDFSHDFNSLLDNAPVTHSHSVFPSFKLMGHQFRKKLWNFGIFICSIFSQLNQKLLWLFSSLWMIDLSSVFKREQNALDHPCIVAHCTIGMGNPNQRQPKSSVPAWKRRKKNPSCLDRNEAEVFLDAIEQQLDTPIQTDHPAELNVLTNDDHHAQGW